MGVMPVIAAKNLVKRFDGRDVLSGVNLDVMPGETMVIMGGSGSGKSTLLRILIGSMKPDEGEILLFGKNVCCMGREELDEVRKRIGILFQSGALFNSMTLAENIALPLQEHTNLPRETIEIGVNIKLDLVGLLEHSQKFPAQISGGMKKRAGLARALALDPEILFYDEPSAGLDPVTSAQIDELILNLTRKLGVTSVVVTHEMDSAFTIGDRMAMLDKGRMLKVDSRDWFDGVRTAPESETHDWSQDMKLIRQFLRGDAQGPITDRRDVGLLERRLLGENLLDTPSIMPSRG